MGNTPKDFIDSVNTKSDYDNFSEEVQIDNVTIAGKMALYTVTNKNGVTFQKVPGQPNLENRGYMGFVNGDRARPIMLSGSVKIQETQSTDNSGTDLMDQVDMTPSVAYDIELTAFSDAGDDTETKTYYIVVG